MRTQVICIVLFVTTALGADPVRIATAPAADTLQAMTVSAVELGPASGSQERPAIATDGQLFMAVWTDYRYGEASIFASRFDTAGRSLDPQGTWLGSGSEPAIAWNGREYLVAWSSNRGVSLIHLNRNGVIASAASLLTSEAASGTALGWNGESYLIAYTVTSAGGASGIRGAVLDGDGQILLGPLGLSSEGARNPRLATDGDAFLLAFEDKSGVGVTRISGGGAGMLRMLGPPPTKVPPSRWMTQAFPDVAFDGREYLVVWSDGSLRAQRVGRDGVPIGGPQIVRGGGDYAITPRVAPAQNGWLVISGAATQSSNDFADLTASTLDRSLGTTSSSTIVSAPSGQFQPAMATVASRTLVLWHDERLSGSAESGDLVAMPLSASGAPAGDAQLAALAPRNQLARDVAIAGGVTLVTWIEQIDDDTWTAFWRRFESDGTPIDPAPRMLAGDAVQVHVAATGDTFLVVWSGGTTASGVRALRIDVHGDVLDREPLLVSAAGASPAVATNGRDFLVAWAEERNIHAASVMASGMVANGATISSTATYNQGTPVIAWNGSSYLVAWNVSDAATNDWGVSARAVGTSGAPSGEVSVIAPVQRFGSIVYAAAASGKDALLGTRGGASHAGFLVANSVTSPVTVTIAGAYVVWDGSQYIAGESPMASSPTGQVVAVMTKGNAGTRAYFGVLSRGGGRTRAVRR